MMSGPTAKIPTFLGVFLIFASLCLPALAIGEQYPSIHWFDIGLPFMLLLLFMNRSKFYLNWLHALSLLMAIYVGFTILIQGHASTISDYFEIYKWLKFGVVLLFFSLLDFNLFKKFVPILFLMLVLINLAHFFNFPGINKLLENHYNGGIQLQFFGKNSLGEPAVKRMVGTMGNPNINALLFSFFSIFFLPIHFQPKRFFLFLTALTMVFLCQSRTALVVVLGLLTYLAIFQSQIWTRRQWLQILIGLSISYLLAWMLATSFFKYSAYSSSLLDGTALYSGSVRGRFETWSLLGQQIYEYPIFGHGPYKRYFYLNHIYAENEYILMTWRYGLLGLLVYLLLYWIPFSQFSRTKNPRFIPFILVILLMSISALTNNPFTERNIEVLFCLALAWAYQRLTKPDAEIN